MYNHRAIEAKWKQYWLANKSFRTTENRPKKAYILDMYPYPSGAGLHVGHLEGYTATDILARYKRFCGFDVLHPIGWDAFGLPAEQYAFKTGNSPKDFTRQNIANFRRQLQDMGFSYDYDKEVDTTDPQYYKWTQWIFLQMYKKGLAVRKNVPVNWCAELGTVLANEEVLLDKNGNPVSERGGFPVVKREMEQWVLRITEYADRLLGDLRHTDWPDSIVHLQQNWIGKSEVNGQTTYHMRDWVFSRQRYWGEPFPLMFDAAKNVYLVEDLPLVLPEDPRVKIQSSGTGESPLKNFGAWVNVTKDGKTFQRETHTMPQWAGSSWYFLAYIMKQDDGTYLPLDSAAAKAKFKKWMPVDIYVGGQEHATLHLIYARFWHKFLQDIGIVDVPEPFIKLINQGMILGADGTKMSKSVGNVVNPDELVDVYGADALRVYEMFMGPLTETKNWSTAGLQGIHKWLGRVHRFYENLFDVNFTSLESKSTTVSDDLLHRLIRDVTLNIEACRFNLAISNMMVFINESYKCGAVALAASKTFLVLLSPFAPFIAESLYQDVQNQHADISHEQWPQFDASKILEQKVKIIVQVNGKLRGTIETFSSLTVEQAVDAAQKIANVNKYLVGMRDIQHHYVPGKVLNFIVKGERNAKER